MEAEEVKKFAREKGADLVGIAPADRFMGAPKGHRPGDLLPEAEGVVVMAMRIPLSVVKSIPSVYYNLSYHLINAQLRVLAHRVATYIEDRGFEALPLDPAESDYVRDVEITREEPEAGVRMLASFSHRHAAVLAGLGEMSKASYVVVPRLGPRVRFVSVLTTAHLRPDHEGAMSWGLICKPEACDSACVEACPPGALTGDGRVDHFKCRRYRGPEVYTLDYFKRIVELIDRGVPPMRRAEILSRLHPELRVQICGRCVKACPIGITV
ncbi:MAG: hypothetical protein ACE5GD_07020 [Candidatus Geothermarchaeales archaeon]